MARFTLPRDIYHGKGSVKILKKLQGSRAMICVGGSSMKKFGFLDRAEQYLKEVRFSGQDLRSPAGSRHGGGPDRRH